MLSVINIFQYMYSNHCHAQHYLKIFMLLVLVFQLSYCHAYSLSGAIQANLYLHVELSIPFPYSMYHENLC
jgi:hypothetical protein